MNWNTINSKWTEVAGSIRDRWGKLTEDDVTIMAGNRERFQKLLQERYNLSETDAALQIKEWATQVLNGHEHPTSLSDLYISELKDILSAENQLVKALPRVIEAVETEELAAALQAHFDETRTHVQRINEIFSQLGEPVQQRTCEAMKGLLKEADQAVEAMEKGPVRDAALIGACQRIEHYEIAVYGTIRAFAWTLGFDAQARILGLSLDEEAAADEKLSDIAMDTVNALALRSMRDAAFERA